MKFTSVRKFACVLSLTSIFSIGFASWTSFTPMQELTLSGNTISADEVNYPIEYFGIKIATEQNYGRFVYYENEKQEYQFIDASLSLSITVNKTTFNDKILEMENLGLRVTCAYTSNLSTLGFTPTNLVCSLQNIIEENLTTSVQTREKEVEGVIPLNSLTAKSLYNLVLMDSSTANIPMKISFKFSAPSGLSGNVKPWETMTVSYVFQIVSLL